jgi:GTP-binding protein EngB required for normal cell division
VPASDGFNESHQRRLLASAQYADRLIGDIEQILSAAESKSPFPKYRPDVSLPQARLIRGQLARFRDHLSRVLSTAGIHYGGPQFGALHSIRVTLTFVRIAIQEMNPEYLRGYGDLPGSSAAELRGLCMELEGLVDALERTLALGPAVDLQARLERLHHTRNEVELLRVLDRITTEEELAEFRTPLLDLVERLESPRFEIAVFGRVSSGKSSLLNHLLETNVLPVGVNPITAVPTRLVYGAEAHITVTLFGREVKRLPIEELATYASEEKNPGNELGVTRLVVALPSQRLRDGLTLVDTPGLGALATAGAAETRAYLPQCDQGILLLSAASPIGEEDLNTIQALSLSGIPVMVLLSKADLLSPQDRARASDYIKQQVAANLGLTVEVHPVSTVGNAEDLLRAWFDSALAPLFERHRELAADSIRRKAGALREAVAGTLRLKLGQSNAAPSGAVAPDEVERRLRTAAGELEETRRFCLDASDRLREMAVAAAQKGLDAMLEFWETHGSSDATAAGIIQPAIQRLAVEAGAPISERLTLLAGHLDAVLSLAAELLHDAPASGDPPLLEIVREMPRFEAAWPDLRIARPWFFGGFRRITRLWLARRLQAAFGAALQSAFTNYGRAVQSWCGRILTTLQERFDARADAYRAQLARLGASKPLPESHRQRMEAHLAELERISPAA